MYHGSFLEIFLKLVLIPSPWKSQSLPLFSLNQDVPELILIFTVVDALGEEVLFLCMEEHAAGNSQRPPQHCCLLRPLCCHPYTSKCSGKPSQASPTSQCVPVAPRTSPHFCPSPSSLPRKFSSLQPLLFFPSFSLVCADQYVDISCISILNLSQSDQGLIWVSYLYLATWW